jgi:GrpB-like predicted nucleotidyltransferase (UPF0157 family)
MLKHQDSSGSRLKLALLAAAVRGKGLEDAVCLKARWFQRGSASRFDLLVLDRIHMSVLRRLQRLRPLGEGSSDESDKRALGVHNSDVLLVPHNRGWPEIFQKEANLLRRELDGQKIEIYHIGSTSVPGLPAKPIIDIAIGLPEDDFENHVIKCRKALERLGYRYLGDRGRSGGHMFERESGRVRTHAIQVHAVGSPGLHETLRFRQMLLDDSNLVREYAEIKAALARLFPRQRLVYVWYKAHWLRHQLLDRNTEHPWGRWLVSARIPTMQTIFIRSVIRRHARQ